MIPSKEPHLEISAITDQGSKGRINEDSYEIKAFTLGEDDDTPVLLALVADGIGVGLSSRACEGAAARSSARRSRRCSKPSLKFAFGRSAPRGATRGRPLHRRLQIDTELCGPPNALWLGPVGRGRRAKGL